MGKIAREITRSEQAGNEKTPVQKTMDMMAYALLGVVCVLAIIVFSVNKWDMSHETIGYAISVGIAVIPEGLVAVVSFLSITYFILFKKLNSEYSVNLLFILDYHHDGFRRKGYGEATLLGAALGGLGRTWISHEHLQ